MLGEPEILGLPKSRCPRLESLKPTFHQPSIGAIDGSKCRTVEGVHLHPLGTARWKSFAKSARINNEQKIMECFCHSLHSGVIGPLRIGADVRNKRKTAHVHLRCVLGASPHAVGRRGKIGRVRAEVYGEGNLRWNACGIWQRPESDPPARL